MAKIDLHLHSNFSDGHDAPERVVALCKEAGVGLMALTDHDTVKGVERALAYGRKIGVSVIPGVEVTTVLDGTFDVHILGLNVDATLPFAEDLFKQNNDEWRRLITSTMAKLKEDGLIEVTVEELTRIHQYPGHCVTLIHLIDYLVHSLGWSFDQAKRTVFGFEHLGLQLDRSKMLTVVEGIAAIKKLGGVPVLAHPGDLEKQFKGDFQQKREALKTFLTDARELGLRGIEAYYPKHTEAMMAEYAKLGQRMELMLTAGRDYHGRHGRSQELGMSELTPEYILRHMYSVE